MSPRVSRIAASLALVVAFAWALALAGCGNNGDGSPVGTATPSGITLGWGDELSDNGKLNVVTTVAPISSIVRNIGGTRINLRGLIPDGADSHTFEPAPSDARILSLADLIFINGLHLEEPTKALAEANLREGAEIFALGDHTVTPEEYVYDFSFPEDRGNPNPHLWTDITKAMKYAELVRERLKARDPVNAAYYQSNWVAYDAKLKQLHEAMILAAKTIPGENRKLLTYHDSFPYFGATYGFKIIGAIQPSDFAEPSASDVAKLIDQVKAEKVPAIFGSEVFPSPVLEQIAAETGARFIDKIRDDAPPGEPNSAEHTFIGMMRNNMRLIAEGLGGDPSPLDTVTPDDTYAP